MKSPIQVVILLLCGTIAVCMAQQGTPTVTIDGHLSEPFWQALIPERLVPSEPGVPEQTGGEIRAIVVGRYLYVGARLPEPDGRVLARSIGRNPIWEDEDILRIMIGPEIRRSTRILLINPLGAYSVEEPGPVTYRNESVFPYSDEREARVVEQGASKYLVATSIGEREWDGRSGDPAGRPGRAYGGSSLRPG